MIDLGLSRSDAAILMGEILWDRVNNPLTPEQRAIRTLLDYAAIVDTDYEFPGEHNLEVAIKALATLGVSKDAINAVRSL